MRLTQLIVIGFALAGSTGTATAADVENGKQLHNQACQACHGTEVYTRADRRIQSLDALRAQVQRCTKAAGVDWSSEQIGNVVSYLNQEFYGFK